MTTIQKNKRVNGNCSLNLLRVLLVVPFLFLSDERCASSVCFATAEESLKEDAVLQHGRDLALWLNNKGGYISDKLEIRRRIPGDPKSPSGVFAVKDIAPNEVIFRFPRHSYLHVPNDQVLITNLDHYKDKIKDYEDDDEAYEQFILEMDRAEMDIYFDNCCLLVKRLLAEIMLYRTSPSSSEFEPYIRYLEETQPRGQLPVAYSHEGRALLRKIQGIIAENLKSSSSTNTGKQFFSPNFGLSPLPPFDLVDWIEERFVKRGCFHKDDTDAYHAAELTIQRGFDLELIPIWDMVNHETIELVNVETNSLRSKEGLVVHAKHHIYAGDEILYTYNHCTDCSEVGVEWGTPGIYRDFGFVEDYPQEWPFLDQEVYATIIRDEQNPNQFKATFYSELVDGELEEYGPDETALRFFDEQLSRLQDINVQEELQAVPSSFERSMIEKFYSSLVTAIKIVINAGVEMLDEDDEEEGDALLDDEL